MKKEQICKIADLNTKIKALMNEQNVIEENTSLRLFDPTFVMKEPGLYSIKLIDADRAVLVKNRQIEIDRFINTIEKKLLAIGRV